MNEPEFRKLVQRLSPKLVRAVAPLTKSEADSQEVIQDVWIAVWNSRKDRPVSDVQDAWVHGIAINIAKSYTRKAVRRERIVHGSPQVERRVVRQPSIEATLLLEEVWEEISKLPDMQRRVLLARLIDGHSVREVANSLGRAPGTVKAHLHHALKKLRSRFGDSVESALQATGTSNQGIENANER